MSFESFRKKIEDVQSPEHVALRDHVKKLANRSRETISKNFATWDTHDAEFRSKRPMPSRDDQRAADEGKGPQKLIVPLTFSQIMTFVSFCVMSITQNRRFFELEATGQEDNPLKEPMELILERDVRRNQWTTFLVQFFLDVARFSIGAAEVCYREETRWMKIKRTETVQGAFGQTTETTTEKYEEIPVFVGNKIYPVSPYRFLWDTSLPLTRFQEGEYCGSEDIFQYAGLRGDSNLFNLDKIPKFSETEFKERQKCSRVPAMPCYGGESRDQSRGAASTSDGGSTGEMVKSGPVVITKMVCDIIPKDFVDEDENKGIETLGDETHPIRYLVWLANDKTVVRFEEAMYFHGQFPYIAGQFIGDQHKAVNESLASTCDQITSLITWKLNAHVTSQRNSLESKFVYDPAGVSRADLDSRSPYIALKKGASHTGVDRYLKQFATVDTTQNVMKDVGDLKELLEAVTGFSGAMQGQYSSGRRSATQDRVVAQGAGARGKTTLGGIWDTAFEPLGKQLIANNRQEMDFETFARILGSRELPINPETQTPFTIEELFGQFQADPVSIALSEDFFVFDGTLPSEKAFLAQSLQEILMECFSNPQVAMVLGFGPTQIKELFSQIYLLRGVTPALLPAPQPVQAPVVGPPQVGGPVPPPQVLPPPSPTASASNG